MDVIVYHNFRTKKKKFVPSFLTKLIYNRVASFLFGTYIILQIFAKRYLTRACIWSSASDKVLTGQKDWRKSSGKRVEARYESRSYDQ